MFANSPMRCLTMVLLVLAMGWSSAVAGTTNLLVTGQLSSASTNGLANGLDNSTFELWLAFDEPTRFDPDRSSLSTPTLTYLADTWSLAYFRGSTIVAEYNPGTHPDAVGFAELTGELTGFDSSETFLFAGVDEGPLPAGESPIGTLIDTTFVTPDLVEAFFTNRLQDLPGDMESLGGIAFDESTGRDLFVLEAQLAVVSVPDQPQGGSGRDEGQGPQAIPTPTAAAAGALLMIGIATRRRRDDAE
ncbi:hypothetical protein [Algisphaera agarilytica]|uniref:PEP-CTERM protein-sorting domain-containing protein n=1 Tax=Algisphaera agarilytica TaxID=1385975 RepID=A0A7X0H5J8_9BACT|nr:hypothetical protein [Algisphaera agarilytica]MBB6429538.1 hypothetical protein [Algisphaera agarilytica]